MMRGIDPNFVLDYDPGYESADERAAVQVADKSILCAREQAHLLRPFRVLENGIEKVLQVDDRIPIYETEIAPWRMICALRIETNSGKYAGTGWLAGDRTVITAAHNLFDKNDGWAKSIEVIPALDRFEQPPFKQIVSSRFSVVREWRENLSPDHDLGVIHLDRAFDPSPGHFGIAVAKDNELIGMNVNISGYPMNVEIQGQTTFGGSVLFSHRNRLADFEDLRLYYTVDTSEGNSGSPVWVWDDVNKRALVIGVHAYGYTDGGLGSSGKYNYCPRITAKRFRLIQNWIQDAPKTDEQSVYNKDDHSQLPAPAQSLMKSDGSSMTSDILAGTTKMITENSSTSVVDAARNWVAPVSAAIFLFIYAFFLWMMFDAARDSALEEGAWLKLQWVVHGIEAIAFAAAGLLFGIQTQRAQTQRALDEAAEQKTRTLEAEKSLVRIKKQTALALDSLGSATDTERSNTHTARQILNSISD